MGNGLIVAGAFTQVSDSIERSVSECVSESKCERKIEVEEADIA